MVSTLSTSSLSLYDRCPLQFKFKYIDNLPSEVTKNHAALLGTALHSILETMYKTKEFSKQYLMDNWINVFRNCCKQEQVIFSTTGQEEFYIKEGFKILNKYYSVAKSMGFFNGDILFIEKYFKVPLKNFNLTGKIDLVLNINKNIIILDYKSGKKELNSEELKIDKQLTFYSWALRKLGFKESKVGLFYLRTGHILYSVRNRHDFLRLAKKAINTMNNIRKCKFTPTFNCMFCEYPDSCRKWCNDNKIIVNIFNDEI